MTIFCYLIIARVSSIIFFFFLSFLFSIFSALDARAARIAGPNSQGILVP